MGLGIVMGTNELMGEGQADKVRLMDAYKLMGEVSYIVNGPKIGY